MKIYDFDGEKIFAFIAGGSGGKASGFGCGY